ncbi:MAG: hypothetical protein HZB71_13460 [Betaproteobacteria bacterium]|nr:hypothetical protein [Betaproteobacteria bacterium]
MRYINLYQDEFRPPRVMLPATLVLLLAAVFATLLGAAWAWQGVRLAQFRQEVEAVKTRADALAAQAAALQQPTRQANPGLMAEAESWERRVQALQRGQEAVARGEVGSESGPSARFRALAHASVPGAWLTRIEIAEAGREMRLEGRALSGEEPARLIASLRKEPLFAGLNYAGLNLDAPKEEAGPAKAAPAAPRYLEFTLHARLNEAGGAASPATPGAVGAGVAPGVAALSALANPPYALPPDLPKLPGMPDLSKLPGLPAPAGAKP